jgi:hypothetical protein
MTVSLIQAGKQALEAGQIEHARRLFIEDHRLIWTLELPSLAPSLPHCLDQTISGFKTHQGFSGSMI